MTTIPAHLMRRLRARSREELFLIRQEIDRLLASKRASEAIRLRWEKEAKSLGLSLAEVLGRPAPLQKRKRNRDRSGSRAKPAPGARYRNPDNGSETWSGTGRHPKWLLDKLRSGSKLEDFRI